MKKKTAKNNIKKEKDSLTTDIVSVELDNEDPIISTDDGSSELDPDVLKVIKPSKNKKIIDTTDYIPELEREEFDENLDGSQNYY
ncbi:MAG TPA: hypothetical protein PKK54_02250 [bacterium]|nr:hypothetical protein [bacterium]